MVALFVLDVFGTGLLGGDERTLAVIRSIILPGLPFLEWHASLGIATLALMLAAVVAWLRWGVSWLPIAVMLASVAVAYWVMPLHHQSPAAGGCQLQAHGSDDCGNHPQQTHKHTHTRTLSGAQSLEPELPRHANIPNSLKGAGSRLEPLSASHEFTIVLVVFAFLARSMLVFRGLPGLQRLSHFVPAGLMFPAVELARAAALEALVGNRKDAACMLEHPGMRARAARVNRWARGYAGADVLTGAHAHLRAALALNGLLRDSEVRNLCAEARRQLTGVVDSEPTWTRLLDGTLVAIALDRLGETEAVECWRATLAQRFPLRHGRRTAVLHTPSMLGIGTASPWEHATATALAHHRGWLAEDDWHALRPRCLGVAAQGGSDPESLRLVAAGRLWAALTDDQEAIAILGKRTLNRDPIAAALADLATRARHKPGQHGADPAQR